MIAREKIFALRSALILFLKQAICLQLPVTSCCMVFLPDPTQGITKCWSRCKHGIYIAFTDAQVINNTVNWMARLAGQHIFRARFSAISAADITAAMVSSRALS